MNKTVLFLLIVTALLFFSSCRKSQEIIPVQEIQTMDEMVVNSQFSWQTSRVISLSIRNAPPGIVLVTDEQQTTRLAV